MELIKLVTMKKLAYLSALFAFYLLTGCTTSEPNNIDQRIFGVWHNIEDPNTGVEFNKDGAYYILNSNERMTFGDSTTFSYELSLDSINENNFKLIENSSEIVMNGKLEFINPDKIHILIILINGPTIKGEFLRVTD